MKQHTTISQSASLTAPFTQGGLIIGITGGSGSGKTTLLNEIRKAGGLILDCDAIYHQLLKTDKALLAAIESRFPGTVRGGTLDRNALGKIVFSRQADLAALNEITHGSVIKEVQRQLKNHQGLAAIDAIALLESGLAALCDVTVAITAPEEIRITRLMKRDGITADAAKKRLDAQKDTAYYQENCDYTLENNGSFEDFQGKCLAFLRQLGIMKAEV